MTEMLYLEDSYLTEFTATVEEGDDDVVVLDRTAFYPTGGGQPHDEGTLTWDGGGADVVDVTKDKGTVLHTLEGSTPDEGAAVEGAIDWERRYALMRVHTAAHLLSAAVEEVYDAPATGGQLYRDRARLDFEIDGWDPDVVADIQKRVNGWIREDVALTWYEVPREVMEAEDLSRLKADLLPDFIDPVRIVQIGGVDGPAADVDPSDQPWKDPDVVDAQPGGGTHLQSTGEVGPIEITETKSKGAEYRRFYYEVEDREAPEPVR
jgi:misacylated tRNA(Ala) deacylase